MKVILISSLLANIAFALFYAFSSVPPTASALAVPNPPAATFKSLKPERMALFDDSQSYAPVWKSDTKHLYDQLRAWGAPNNIIVAVLVEKDMQESSLLRQKILYPNGVKRWSGPGLSNKETFGRLADMYTQRRAGIRAVMGTAHDVVLVEADRVTRLKWGEMSDDQLSKIKEITESFETVMLKERGVSGSVDSKSVLWERSMDEAYAAKVAEVLGDKTDDFLTFNSYAARALQKELARAGVEVDEAQYRALVKGVYKVRSDFAVHADFDNKEGFDDIYGKMAALSQVYESVLGAGPAVRMVCARDLTLTNIMQILPAFSDSDRYAFYREYATVMSGISRVMTGGSQDDERSQRVAVEAKKLHSLLASKAPIESVDRFLRSSNGRFLKIWLSGQSPNS